MNPCLLIPIFNHGSTIEAVVEELRPLRLPCLIVDDGSNLETRYTLEVVAKAFPWVTVRRRDENGGCGAALKTGYRLADQLGFTHVLQLDADGQHDPAAIPSLLSAARKNPEALVLGAPVFDRTAPWGRLLGRRISIACVWLETFSTAIRDPLCGLRCLPLEPTLRILRQSPCGDHMEFDPEIIVRLVWSGVPVINVGVNVRYFEDGVSHFAMVRDNARISWLHTRFIIRALSKLPAQIIRTLKRKS